MTRMVASLRRADEVPLALAAGVDMIEAGDPATLAAIVDACGGRRPVSFCARNAGDVTAAAEAGAASIRVAGPAVTDVPLYLTVPADEAADIALPTDGFAGIVIDADGARLLDRISILALGRLARRCRAARLEIGLAGGIESPDVPRLLLVEPDMLLFSRALRGADGALQRHRLRLIRGQIPAAADRTEPRLLARLHQPRDAAGDGDRIFVHDLVLPVSVGAYAHETHQPQKVRFAIDAVVAHARDPADLRDVVSYDIIVDGIRLLVAEGHVALVETLAERIAAMLLRHPRVIRVSVQLEKLETGAGIVGVAITRGRGDAVARAERRTR